MIPFNKPYMSGSELRYIEQALKSGKFSGNGEFTKKCHSFFEETYGFGKCFLTSSCTDALEMAALLCDLQEGDEVIMPSFTFVSTANAFVLRGAKIVFCDSRGDHPGIDEQKVESLITKRTKAIICVHYAGVACNMDKLVSLCKQYKLFLVEDAAQAIDSTYNGKPLGTFGDFATFSFHETKNIISGEGGLLVVNNNEFVSRAEIIWEKGTNRTAFFRGEIDKYQWVDVGSSFLPSEMTAAFLYAQLENLKRIQSRRIEIWNQYLDFFSNTRFDIKSRIPEYASNNGHMFYILCSDLNDRDKLIADNKKQGILSVFHYQSLHKSKFFETQYKGNELPESDRYSEQLVRLPLFYELDIHDVLSKINLNGVL